MAFGFATSSRSDFVHHMHIMAPRLRCRKGKSGLEDRQIVHLGQGTLRPMKSSNASMEKWVRELRPGVPKSNTESIGIHRPCSLAKDRKWRKSSTLPHRCLTLKRAADRVPFSMLKSAGRFISKTTKSMLKKQFPIKKFGRFNRMHYLCTHENPPSLFTMLKSAGRFIFLWHIIQRPTHRPPS